MTLPVPPHPTPDRRQTLGLMGALALPQDSRAQDCRAESRPMPLVCFIRYQIDPFQRAAFAAYARAWDPIIPRCGGRLIGYFLPLEGTNDIAQALIAFASLAEYETYRGRLSADPDAKANFALAQSKRLILREERTFLEAIRAT